MKAAFKKGQAVILKDIPSRPLAPDQIRVRVEACGICSTDLHNNPDEADKEQPFGHEIAGVIDEVGSAVLGLEPGQNVVLESSSACGRCDACRNANQELCTDVQSFSFIKSLASRRSWTLRSTVSIVALSSSTASGSICKPTFIIRIMSGIIGLAKLR